MSIYVLILPLTVSSIAIAAGLFFCKTTKSRVIACMLTPLFASLLTTIGSCIYLFLTGAPVEAFSGYAVCLFILPVAFVWSYVAIPAGIILAFIVKVAAGAFTPYEPYKSDDKRRD